ncbi:MAG: FecR domain-containing protein [Chloroflexota bacterium]|nr:FecR domain-containing protein [Chloroflexota bacterium]MDE3193607.1 FecR domain-containing protein [Chloroflexota bacterium]
MKKVIAGILVVVVAIAAFLYFPRGSALAAVNAAVLSVLNADVSASRAGGDFAPALDGDVFATGDVVRADAKGRAVLTFFEGSTLSVDPGSSVKVVSLVKTSGGGIQLDVEQTLGRTWASVSKLAPDSKFQIHTPTMTATVRGTAFETIVEKTPDGKTVTTIKTDEGTVLVQAVSGGEVSVPAGSEVDVAEGQPAPAAPRPQPPTPKLRFSVPAGVGFVVIDPRGLQCGLAGAKPERQIPRCEVLNGGGQSVVIGEVVPGTYTLVLTAAQAVAGAAIVAEGLGLQGTDFTSKTARSFNVGDLVRTTLPVTVASDGKLGSTGFTPPDLVTSVCGAEATGRVFSSGQVSERAGLLAAYASGAKGQPAAIVYTQSELTQAAVDGLKDAQASLPVTVSGIVVTVDNAGAHLTAQVSAGPLTIAATGKVIAGVEGGKLVLRVRDLQAPPLPSAVTDQLAGALDKSLAQFARELPLDATRVAFRSGCFALIGTTSR